MKQLKNARIWSNEELKKIAEYFKGDVINVSAGVDSSKDMGGGGI